MNILICFNFLYILHFVHGKSYLPIFTSLPPTLVYYSENQNNNLPNLECKVWPPSATIRYYVTSRLSGNSGERLTNQNNAPPLHPIDSDFLDKNNKFKIINNRQVKRLDKLDLHCLASTEFGSVISRPFRIVEARIGRFPSAAHLTSGQTETVNKVFMNGNNAYVNCDPPISYPPAKVKFRVNGTNVPLSKRYRYVKRPNSNQVTMLIQGFEPKDQGFYQCMATNELTDEEVTDPLVQHLKIKNPSNSVPVRILMGLTGIEYTKDNVHNNNQKNIINVREGVNVTLFCAMERAPPPDVTTYKYRSNDAAVGRHTFDKEFGLLTIREVDKSDEDSYYCSEAGASDSAVLKVKQRLSIKKGPHDIKISKLGDEAKFECQSNDELITPHWYFNGRIRTQSRVSGSTSSLLISRVRKEDLGVYQCVARSQDEWVTQIATLSLKNNTIIYKDSPKIANPLVAEKISHGDSRGNRIKKNVLNDQPIISQPRQTENLKYFKDGELAPPEIHYIDDNLAVLLKWQQDNRDGIVKLYRIQYRSIDAKKLKTDSSNWSIIETLIDEVKSSYFYVTNRIIFPQRIYRFRIQAELLSGATIPSKWSEHADFSHVYDGPGPTIQEASQYNKTHAIIEWGYSPLDGRVTFYKVLVRATVVQGHSTKYKKFRNFKIPSSNYNKALVGNFEPGTYQVVVYGVYENKPERRMITRYSSQAVFQMKKMAPKKSNISSSLVGTNLMLIILGGLAGFMGLVIIILVVMCYCRERKSGARMNRYKDPAKLLHNGVGLDLTGGSSTKQQSSFLLASINAAVNGVGNNNTNSTTEKQALTNGNNNNNTVSSNMLYCQQKRQPPSGGSGHDLSVLTDGGNQAGDHQSLLQYPSGGGGGTLPYHYHYNHQVVPPGAASMGSPSPQPPSVTYFYNPHHNPHHNAQQSASLNRPPNMMMTPQQQQQQNYNIYPSQQTSPMMMMMMNPNSGSTTLPQMSSSQQQMLLQQQQQQQIEQQQLQNGTHSHHHHHHHGDIRSQDGGESVYSYFSQNSNSLSHNRPNTVTSGGLGAGVTADAGSQTINSTGTGSVGHRHHRRKRRKTNHSSSGGNGGAPSTNGVSTCLLEGSEPPPPPLNSPPMISSSPLVTGTTSPPGTVAMVTSPSNPHPQQPLQYNHHHPGAVREAMYDTPASATAATNGNGSLSRMALMQQQQYAMMMQQNQLGGYYPGPGVAMVMPPGTPQSPGSPPAVMMDPVSWQHAMAAAAAAATSINGGAPGPHHHHHPPLVPGLPQNNTLTRRGTPTLFVEPPRIRDYTEYGIPNTTGSGPNVNNPSNKHATYVPHQQFQQQQQQQQQLAHLSQQNLHLHNQNQLLGSNTPYQMDNPQA